MSEHLQLSEEAQTLAEEMEALKASKSALEEKAAALQGHVRTLEAERTQLSEKIEALVDEVCGPVGTESFESILPVVRPGPDLRSCLLLADSLRARRMPRRRSWAI